MTTTTTRRPRKKKGAATNAESSAEPLGHATGTLADSPTESVTTTNAGTTATTDTNLMECLPPTPVSEQRPIEQQPVEPTGTDTPTPEEARHGTASDGAAQAAASASTMEPRLRTWVVDDARGYCRMSDEDYHRFVLQFSQRPPEDVLTAVRGAGFKFQPDYRGQKNAWVRRNDFEGRLQVEALDKLVNDLIPGPSSQQR